MWRGKWDVKPTGSCVKVWYSCMSAPGVSRPYLCNSGAAVLMHDRLLLGSILHSVALHPLNSHLLCPCVLQNFTRFSSWFGNYSHGNKQHRLLAELSCAMAAGDTGATCSRNSVRRDYLPALRQASVWQQHA